MSRYDGLIIPRSYSEYINKTDAATLLQALQLSGVMDNVPTADSNHPVKSSGLVNSVPVNSVTLNNMHAVTSNAVAGLNFIKELQSGLYTSFLQIPRGVYSMSTIVYTNFTDKPTGVNGRVIFIAGGATPNSDEQIALLCCATSGQLWIGSCYGGTPRYDWKKII